MSSAADQVLGLLHVFREMDDVDQAWGDFGAEEGRKLLAHFTEDDWTALFDRRHELTKGSLDYLVLLISGAKSAYADRLLIWLVLTLPGWAWIDAAEELGVRLDQDARLRELEAAVLKTKDAVAFIEARLREWLNFPYEGFRTFEDYVSAYSHLLSPGVKVMYTFATRVTVVSQERA